MHVGATRQSDVGDRSDVLCPLNSLHLHLAECALACQRSLPKRVQIQLLRNDTLMHFRAYRRIASICRPSFLLHQTQSYSRYAAHFHSIAGLHRSRYEQQEHCHLRFRNRTVHQRAHDHHRQLLFLPPLHQAAGEISRLVEEERRRQGKDEERIRSLL